MTLLYLDIDGPLPKGLEMRVQMVCDMMAWPIEAIRLDRTRRGWHVVVAVKRRIAAASVVAAQAIMGSDWKREMFNLQRVRKLRSVPKRWRSQWNVLYETHQRNVLL